MKYEMGDQYDKAEVDVECPHCQNTLTVELEIQSQVSGSVEVIKTK